MYNSQTQLAFKAAQALPRWRRGWAMVRACKSALLRDGIQILLVCMLIGLVIALARGSQTLWGQWAYSVPIGLLNWLLIDVGRFFIDQDSPGLFPRGWRGVALIVAGVLLSVVLGTLFGDALHQHSSFAWMQRTPHLPTYLFVLSLTVGLAISLYFYSKGKSAYLTSQIEAISRQAAQAQLKLLQSQLDPHMLFNTLANLRVLIAQEPARAITMLDQLGDFLRATLSASQAQEHSLQAEFDRLEDYLALMQIRLGERLRYTLSLAPDLRQIPVPTLILQSLVENAIVHGLEPKVGGGQIWISATRSATHLTLQVCDDGIGYVDPASTQATHQGFGLAQVRERLSSHYGDLATIDLRALNQVNTKDRLAHPSNPGATSDTPGCQITLRLPLPAP